MLNSEREVLLTALRSDKLSDRDREILTTALERVNASIDPAPKSVPRSVETPTERGARRAAFAARHQADLSQCGTDSGTDCRTDFNRSEIRSTEGIKQPKTVVPQHSTGFAEQIGTHAHRSGERPVEAATMAVPRTDSRTHLRTDSAQIYTTPEQIERRKKYCIVNYERQFTAKTETGKRNATENYHTARQELEEIGYSVTVGPDKTKRTIRRANEKPTNVSFPKIAID